MKHGGVKIVHAHRVLLGRIAEFIGSAVTDPSLHGAGNQERKPLDATIASVATLRHRRAAKLPPQITSVSSSMPRCFRSVIGAAVARFTSSALSALLAFTPLWWSQSR